jgi:hypothetical protein
MAFASRVGLHFAGGSPMRPLTRVPFLGAGISFHSQVAHVVHRVYDARSCPQKFLPLHTASEIARFSSTPPEWLNVLALSQGGPEHASAAQESLLAACGNLPLDVTAGGRGYIMGAYVGGVDVLTSSGSASTSEAVSIQARGRVSALCAAIRSCSQEFLLGASGAKLRVAFSIVQPC